MVAAGFKGDAYKDALYKASNATSIDTYKVAMQEMKDLDPKAIDWLADKSSQHWSKSHFRTKSVCDAVLNNHCETYNNMILKSRLQPILVMLELIREGQIHRLQKCRDKANLKWHEQLCPKVKAILDFNMDKVKFCRALKVNDNHFQISVNELQYNVTFEDFSCNCRRWQLSGIPRSHALCAIGHMRYNPLEYVHAYYSVETYKKVYAPVIFGINGKGLWGETNFIPPLPPNWGRGKGRPKHVRRRAPDEPQKKVKNASKRGPKKPTKSRRMQTTLKCSFCKLQGHNAKTCQIKKAKEIEQLQEADLIASEEFANAFAHVVNSDVEISELNVHNGEEEIMVQEELANAYQGVVNSDVGVSESNLGWSTLFDGISIIEPSNSTNFFRENISSSGSKEKLQIKKKNTVQSQFVGNESQGSSVIKPSCMNVVSSSAVPSQFATVNGNESQDQDNFQFQTNAPIKVTGPSPWEQASQHVVGLNSSISSGLGVTIGGKRFVPVSQLAQATKKSKGNIRLLWIVAFWYHLMVIMFFFAF